MRRIELNTEWKMRMVGEESFFPATVPGSVYQDLLDQGRMEDPYYRDNEDAALEFMKHEFEYRKQFDVDLTQISEADEVILRFHGIDTIAEISLNGFLLGQTANMHRIYDYSITELLKEHENELVIKFASPVEFVAKEFEKDPAILGTEDCTRGFPKIRKAHYMFGWDWGPRLPDAGIWKPVELLFVQKARLTKVYIHQSWDENLEHVELCVDARVLLAQDRQAQQSKIQHQWAAQEADWRLYEEMGLVVKVTIFAPDGRNFVRRWMQASQFQFIPQNCGGRMDMVSNHSILSSRNL